MLTNCLRWKIFGKIEMAFSNMIMNNIVSGLVAKSLNRKQKKSRKNSSCYNVKRNIKLLWALLFSSTYYITSCTYMR